MTTEEYRARCQEAIDLAGDQFDRLIGMMMGHFALAYARRESTGEQDQAKLLEGMAEAHIALTMTRMKNGFTKEQISAAIEERLTKV